MPRRREVPKRETLPDPQFGSTLISKFVSCMMIQGKKSVAEGAFYGSLELVKDRRTKEPMAPFDGASPVMTAFRKYMLDHGVYLYTHWHTVLIIPPLIITEEQLEEGFQVLDEALKITDQAVGLELNLE